MSQAPVKRDFARAGCVSVQEFGYAGTPRRLSRALAPAVAIALALAVAQTQAQAPGGELTGRSITEAPAVAYLFPEQVTVPAGKVSKVLLHFRIAQGLHINSHTPREEYLIPTALSIPEAAGVRLDGATYPAGVDFVLPLDPKTKLSVYTGEFTIEALFVAAAGDHLVEAKLRFQACNNNACMPPRTITAAIDVVGK